MPNLVCPFCTAQFQSSSKLHRHIDSHAIFGGFFCDLCEKSFRRETTLFQHWRKTCEPIRIFLSEEERDELPNHVLRYSVFRYIIEKNKNTDMDTEEQSTSSMPSSFFTYCNYCNVTLPSYAVARHYGIHKGKSKPGELLNSKSPSFICDLCGLSFRHKLYLLKHWRKSCSEVIFHSLSMRELILNRELHNLVEILVKNASVCDPSVEPDVDLEIDDSCTHYKRTDHYSEFSDGFLMDHKPTLKVDASKWTQRRGLLKSCVKCNRKFVNQGRLEWHIEVVHGDLQLKEKCEFCWQKFREKMFLFEHLRKSCLPMKVDFPNEEYRRKLSTKELLTLMEKAKTTWGRLLKEKKTKNLADIKMIINKIDNASCLPVQPERRTSSPTIGATSSYLRTRKRPTLTEDGVRCHFCKVFFAHESSLRRHVEIAHFAETKANTEKSPVVLPIVCIPKPQTAQFFDECGNFFKTGRYLESYPEIVFNIDTNDIKSGFCFRLEMEHDVKRCLIMEVHGNLGSNRQYIVLEEKDIKIAYHENGDLKQFFRKQPLTFDDLPVLEKQV